MPSRRTQRAWLTGVLPLSLLAALLASPALAWPPAPAVAAAPDSQQPPAARAVRRPRCGSSTRTPGSAPRTGTPYG